MAESGTQSGNRLGPNESLQQVRSKVSGCERCGLREGCEQVVTVQGRAQARILFIGEGPGAAEDETGIPFVGGAGRLLRKVVAREGIHSRDVAFTNVVRCRPPKNRTPYSSEIEACRVNLLMEMAVVDAQVVVLCGAVAFNVFRPDLEVSNHWGVPMMIEEGRVAIGCIHPAAALRKQNYTPRIHKVVKQAKMRMRGRMMDEWPSDCVVCGEEGEYADSMGVFYCKRHEGKMEAWRTMGSQLGLEMA